MITLGKRDTLHARRQVKAYLLSASVTKKVFSDLGPRFSDRPGGYCRIVRIGPRVGDGADMAIIELIGSELEVKKAQREEAEAGESADKSAEPDNEAVVEE